MAAPASPILFSEVFGVDPAVVDSYGAFDVSLITDLPLFIDPFLLFNSGKPEYQELHNSIIQYLRFLRDKSVAGEVDDGLLRSWFYFTEVKQTWLGFTEDSNQGRGLGRKFAEALRANFGKLFSEESLKVTKGQHLEKLCLIGSGVGKDSISDFTTNLIKGFLLDYTQTFAASHLEPKDLKKYSVHRSEFNYDTERWDDKLYELPTFEGDYVLLVPRDLLARDDTWINAKDLVRDFHQLPRAISNLELQAQINNYFRKQLPDNPKIKEVNEAIRQTILTFPELIDYFIKYKEETGNKAKSLSDLKVRLAQNMFLRNTPELRNLLETVGFYDVPGDSYSNALRRLQFLKHVVEDNDGYRLFWDDKGLPIKREKDLQVIYRLTWFNSAFDANREVNNGRGPVDYKVSKGSIDKALVEFKLASNSQLERNLEKQVEVYAKANQTEKYIKVIMCFSAHEQNHVQDILTRLKINGAEHVIVIDARRDNKPSASKA